MYYNSVHVFTIDVRGPTIHILHIDKTIPLEIKIHQFVKIKRMYYAIIYDVSRWF